MTDTSDDHKLDAQGFFKVAMSLIRTYYSCLNSPLVSKPLYAEVLLAVRILMIAYARRVDPTIYRFHSNADVIKAAKAAGAFDALPEPVQRRLQAADQETEEQDPIDPAGYGIAIDYMFDIGDEEGQEIVAFAEELVKGWQP